MMKDINVTKLYAEFDKRCFELCLNNSFRYEKEFVEAAFEKLGGMMIDLYGNDDAILHRRIAEYLHDYNYRDPVTDMQMTFVDWSNFFHDEFEFEDNLKNLYERCKLMRLDINELKGINDILSKALSNTDEFKRRASKKEIQEEAISRMKAINLYPYIVTAFEKNGTPQVYEPPYGASYSLEDNEIDKVHAVEKEHNIIVWGVIRCFTNVNGIDSKIDCLLYVSSDKSNWNREREQLMGNEPFVYALMGDSGKVESGQIVIYMSQGGTPLKK